MKKALLIIGVVASVLAVIGGIFLWATKELCEAEIEEG